MHRLLRACLAVAGLALALAGCDSGAAPATPPITPGTSAVPRDVNIVARDYAYVPAAVDLVPGETVRLHVINGGLVIHEAIVGSLDQQLAWEEAERPFADPPPGPTPVVPVPAGFEDSGVRVVVGSGQLLEVTWTVPADAATAANGWYVGCHIPGHWDKGMVVPVRFVDEGGQPLATPGASPASSAGSPSGG
jgi:uncharacterized cupredoxin-like copper-binding protein